MGQEDQVFGRHQVLCQLVRQFLELRPLAFWDRAAHGLQYILNGVGFMLDL